jgi:hypothetical protein
VHYDTLTLRRPQKGAAHTEHHLRFHLHVPIPAPPPYFLFAESERWLGVHTVAELDFSAISLPRDAALPYAEPCAASALIPRAVVGPQLAPVFAQHPGPFNAVESSVLHALFEDGRDVLLCAAAGNGVGNGTCAALAIGRCVVKVRKVPPPTKHGRAEAARISPHACHSLPRTPLQATASAKVAPILVLTAKAHTARLRGSVWHKQLGQGLGLKVNLRNTPPSLYPNAD